MKKLVSLSLFLLVAFLTASAAAAEVKTGHFQAQLYGEEDIQWDTALNDGYESTWYRYPQNSPPFWNEWWYDDPYQLGGKWVQVTFDYSLINPGAPGDVHVTINWTNSLWVGQAAPPNWQNSANPELYIKRLSDPEYNIDQGPWNFHLEPGSPGRSWDSGKIWLPINYNPEWVSVDVQGMGNVGISNGVLLHECVPEPATLILLCLGGLSLLRKRRT
jgi:hypothetical protein